MPIQRQRPIITLALLLLTFAGGRAVSAQDTPPDTTAPPAAAGLPVFATLGLGYGLRWSDCALCASPEDNESFSGHLGVGRPLGHGLGVGLDVSVWRRTRPGPPSAADSSGARAGTRLSNMLGNASLSFSYHIAFAYVRAGGGLAWGHQDQELTNGEAEPVVARASGVGIGYSAGAGFTLPVHSVISLVFFGNWNYGTYDMASPEGVVLRGASHRYLELGVGLTAR